MNPELAAIFFGLASAASWGAGDFSGGLATKRNNVYVVIVVSQIFGVVMLAALALLWREAVPPPGHLLYGALAGLAGALGLVALYRGLAANQMGVVAPLTALVAAMLPVVVGVALSGLPDTQKLLGFGFAFAGIWTISRSGDGGRVTTRALMLALLAGASFGLFFIFIDQVSEDAVFWPLVAARLASITVLTAFIIQRRSRKAAGAAEPPLNMPLLILTGVLEAGGNVFFALASASGRLDIAAVLSSLYPASTVFLAWLVLKERLSGRQWLGIVATLGAIVLITT